MDLKYMTEESVELAPMDQVAEATTPEAQVAALAAENTSLLLENSALEKELNQETRDHEATTKKLHYAERAVVALFQLYTHTKFEGVKVNSEYDALAEYAESCAARIRAGQKRDAARKPKAAQASSAALPASTAKALPAPTPGAA
jgi:regulator of replication initiation timing